MYMTMYMCIYNVCMYVYMCLMLFAYLLVGPLEKQQLITAHNLLIVMRLHICRHHGMMHVFELRYEYVSYSCSVWQDQRSHQWDIMVIYQLVVAHCPETLHILDLMLIATLHQILQMLDTNMLTSVDCFCRR